MPVASVFYKSGFETGLDPGDFCLVDVGLFLFSNPAFYVQVVKFLPIYQRYTHFFTMSCVD